ncbi:DUF397 domain-containing protein [Streptomyces sp. NPDC004608]|uniref:DUF397 domain-containing protein n=1 Tax=Streptomyces sp. NPDC004608 TaxID=3154554 RepID=UPI0033B88C38
MTTIKRALPAEVVAGADWRRSSHSGGSEGQCVEVAEISSAAHIGIAVRDSKNEHGPVLFLDSSVFHCFAAAI